MRRKGGGSGNTANSVPPNTADQSGGDTANPAALLGLAGVTQCGLEGGTLDLKGVNTHLAYDAKNAFVDLFNQKGVVKLGSDPISAPDKSVYRKAVVAGADASVLASRLAKFKQRPVSAAVSVATLAYLRMISTSNDIQNQPLI